VATEMTKRPAGGAASRRRGRQARLLKDLEEAGNGREILAAVARYYRATFARADDNTVERVARELIELTDREAGVTDERAAL